MRNYTCKNRSILIKAAMQKIPCDLTVKNVQYVNVFTGEIYPASVDVMEGIVVRVRTKGEETVFESKTIYDGNNMYLIPGFIDTHMHVESTMMIPENFGRAAIVWGTTTICTDPHEIANVMGIDGVKFMLDNSKNSTLRQLVLAPSCVPAVPGLECAGAEFFESEISEILDLPDVVGIAELMDFVGVYEDNLRMHKIIEQELKRDTFLQGHAPMVSGKELAAYRIGGAYSDHESSTAEELKEKLRMGIHINLRASSLVNQLENLLNGVKDIPYHDFLSICTDDVHAKELLTKGHVNKIVKKIIEAGFPEVDAIRMATINAAREYGFNDLGAVSPGYKADMQLVKNLDGGCPEAVFAGGKLVAKNGVYLGTDVQKKDKTFINTVDISWIQSEHDFVLKAPEGCGNTVNVNVIVPIDKQYVLRKVEVHELPVVDGKVSLEGHDDMQFVCVCNRYGKPNKTIAVFKDSGLINGAVGTTVAHDSHNLVIIYRETKDAFKVAQELKRTGGGICTVLHGKPLYCLELPVAGLMSMNSCEDVAKEIGKLENAFYTICNHQTPVLSCAIMSLPALPGIVITDCGLVDGINQKFVEIFPTNKSEK